MSCIDCGWSGCLRSGRCYHLDCTCSPNNICPTTDAKSKKIPTKCCSKAPPAAPSDGAEDVIMISVRPSHTDWPHSWPDSHFLQLRLTGDAKHKLQNRQASGTRKISGRGRTQLPQLERRGPGLRKRQLPKRYRIEAA